jgi:DNA-binding XRE family transcriptional regulator
MSDAGRPPWSDEEKEQFAILRRQLARRPAWTIKEAARICCRLHPDKGPIPEDRRVYYERTLRDLDDAERRGLLKTAWDVSGEDRYVPPGEIRRHLVFVPRDVFVFAMQAYPPAGSPVPGEQFPYVAADFAVAPDAMTTALVKAMAVASSFLSAPETTGAETPTEALEADEAARSIAEGESASLSQRLTTLRQEARWTVEELADQVNLSRDAVLEHLSGEARPRLKNLQKYEEKFSARLQRPIKLDA